MRLILNNINNKGVLFSLNKILGFNILKKIEGVLKPCMYFLWNALLLLAKYFKSTYWILGLKHTWKFMWDQ